MSPLKNLNGSGSLELEVLGKVVGTVQAAWRSSTMGAARTVVARNGRMIEYFMVKILRALKHYWNQTGNMLKRVIALI